MDPPSPSGKKKTKERHALCCIWYTELFQITWKEEIKVLPEYFPGGTEKIKTSRQPVYGPLL
jgi:hypothetical protein